MARSPPSPPLFPYTTLFRSGRVSGIERFPVRTWTLDRFSGGRARQGAALGAVGQLGLGTVRELVGEAPGPGTDIDAGGVLGRRSEEHTSELQSRENLVCRLL